MADEPASNDRKKLFEVMRGYGVQERLVDVIERIYEGGMVKFEMEGIMTGWCKSDSGVRQGCPLSPLLFNIYVRELGMKVAQRKHGFKYLTVDRDGLMVEKSQAGFLYADDVCRTQQRDPTSAKWLMSPRLMLIECQFKLFM